MKNCFSCTKTFQTSLHFNFEKLELSVFRTRVNIFGFFKIQLYWSYIGPTFPRVNISIIHNLKVVEEGRIIRYGTLFEIFEMFFLGSQLCPDTSLHIPRPELGLITIDHIVLTSLQSLPSSSRQHRTHGVEFNVVREARVLIMKATRVES